MVSPRRRRRPLPDRRYVVADRDRRHPDHAAARRDQAQARLGDAAVLRHQACAGRREGQRSGGSGRGNLVILEAGPARCAPSTATTSASCRPTSRPTRACISRAMAAAATRTATTGSPAASTTCSTCRATGSAPPRSRARSSRIPKVAEAAVVGYPHDIKGQGIYCYVTLKAA